MEQTLADLRQINARFIANFIANDVAAHDRLLHPAFTYLSGTGQRVSRSDYLAAWATGFDPAVIPYWDTRDERIVMLGDVALVSAMNKYTEMVEGVPHVAMAAYTDTYVRDSGVWRCLQAQITPVHVDHWPPDNSIVSVYLRGILQPVVQRE